ncbi:hypothetical protein BWQ96_09561 [Gracilariopsis chorda]|uniref:Uncharacterized protein n=1 Tax=Gracilariopsis chorda TaxID=448386 RepID=A0A2V3IFC4_9FLOR|nr:hypothetical protein BWQ96_09561 [Gracilariopsis chorda]|eukprot:PXF40728.1 hypothetical protein BWQ96_09561 [Gracilariopsis chorda]
MGSEVRNLVVGLPVHRNGQGRTSHKQDELQARANGSHGLRHQREPESTKPAQRLKRKKTSRRKVANAEVEAAQGRLQRKRRMRVE